MNDLIDLSLVYGDQDPVVLAIQLLTAILLSFLVRFYYIRYAAPMGNLGNIGNVLPILAVITFLVILIVKTSLALSLGLVGALSIVRFRAPIKDPMELTFIFLAIAIGLGTGASKHWITTVVVLLILLMDYIRIHFSKREIHGKTLLVDIPGAQSMQTVEKLLSILNEGVNSMRLSRLELGEANLTVVAQLDTVSERDIQTVISNIRTLNEKAKCTLFDSKPVW
jgi:Domain of unknown function (DUF4956)